jgi:outer membrane autotransporter protein
MHRASRKPRFRSFVLFSCAAALAAASGATAAYDADNPFFEHTFAGSEIVPGSMKMYPGYYMYLYSGSVADNAARLQNDYGMDAASAQYVAEYFDANKALPEGLNTTVEGDINLVNPGDAFARPMVGILSGSRTVINGSVSTSNTGFALDGQDVTVNGSINKTSAYKKTETNVNIAADKSITINGGITSHNDLVMLSTPGTITVNGDITLTGDTDSYYTEKVRYYGYDYDREADIAAAEPYYKNLYATWLTTGNKYAHYYQLDNWLYEELSSSAILIGDLSSYADYAAGNEPMAAASVRINGNITVENSYNTANAVRVALSGNGTDWSWKGSASMPGAGCQSCTLESRGIFVSAYEGAVWQVEGADSTQYTNFNKVSSISRWTSYGNTVIDMTKTPDTVLLKIEELRGNGTVIKEKLDPNNVSSESLTDMVILGGRSSGTHTVELHSTGAEPKVFKSGRIPYLQVTVPCPVTQERYGTADQNEAMPTLFLTKYQEQFENALLLSTEENTSGDGKVAHIALDGARYYTYNDSGDTARKNLIVLTKDFETLNINYGNVNNELDVGTRKYKILDPVVEADGSVVFYVEMEGVMPDGTPVPTEDLPFNELSTGAELVTTLAGDGAMYSAWMADLSDLRKRLGEVRYGAQDGLWVKGIAQKDKIDGMTGADFKQKLYGLQLGLDHIVTQDEDRMWLVGANFKYNTIDQKVNAMRYGHGDLKTYGAFLYATYANYKGCYTDLVLSLDSYKQKLSAEQEDNSYVHGKYNTWGWGASVEVGKMFSSGQDDEGWGPWYNHWWIEPQAQLAYYWVNGKKFSLDNGMAVNQKNGDSLIGRLGVVIGKKFNYGKNRKEVDKRYSQFYLKGGVKHEFLGKQSIRVNNDTFSSRLRGTRVYYGAGADWNLTDQLRLYAQVERESGSKYKKDYEVSVGLKWQF